MQAKLLEWVIHYLLTQLTPAVAAEALVAMLRAASGAVKAIAAKTANALDDQVAAKLAEVVEDLAKALKQ